MPNIKDRIKELRKEYGYTQESLAKALGLNAKSSIANYENGSNAPSDDIKLKMCELFNCTMDYLMGKNNFKTKQDLYDNYMNTQYKIDLNNAMIHSSLEHLISGLTKSDDEKIKEILLSAIADNKTSNEVKNEINIFINSFPENQRIQVKNYINSIVEYINNSIMDRQQYHHFLNLFEKNDIKDACSNKFYMMAVYGQISAGQPNWAKECIEGRLPLDTDLMGIVNPEEHFFLRVNGESMNKVIKNGAFALIHKQDLVDDGDIAVVLVNGYDATLKKFTKQGDFVILEPQSNDESFKSQVYDKTTPIKIIGKYVGKMEFN